LILAGLPFIVKTALPKGEKGDNVTRRSGCFRHATFKFRQCGGGLKPNRLVKAVYLIPFILGLGLIVGITFAGNGNASGGETTAFPLLVLYSAVASFAMLLPGISGALMLVVFGIYDVITTALTEFDFAVLIPAVIGILLGIILGAKLIVFLLEKYRLITYSAIIGMVMGSIVSIAQNIAR
jgi:putative membrane protein